MRRGQPRGLALVTVLWGLAILSLIAGIMLASARFSTGAARYASRAAEADAIADAAVARAVLGILDRRLDRRWRVDGTAQTVDILGVPVEIAVQDEYGRIDLNQADGSLLQRLFENAGLGLTDAQALADKVQDWRGSGFGKHLNGATADDYRAAGLQYLPRSGPFQSVEELKLVIGMTPEIYAQVEPALTVYTAKQAINTASAPPEALAALPGFDAQKAADLVAARAGADAAASGPVQGGKIDPAIPLAGWPFSIETRFEIAGRRVARVTVVRITADPARPYWVLHVADGP